MHLLNCALPSGLQAPSPAQPLPPAEQQALHLLDQEVPGLKLGFCGCAARAGQQASKKFACQLLSCDMQVRCLWRSLHSDADWLPHNSDVRDPGAVAQLTRPQAPLTQKCCRHIAGVGSEIVQGTLTGGYLSALTALTVFSVGAIPGWCCATPGFLQERDGCEVN